MRRLLPYTLVVGSAALALIVGLLLNRSGFLYWRAVSFMLFFCLSVVSFEIAGDLRGRKAFWRDPALSTSRTIWAVIVLIVYALMSVLFLETRFELGGLVPRNASWVLMAFFAAISWLFVGWYRKLLGRSPAS